MTSPSESPVNELDRCLVKLPRDAGIYEADRFIAIAFEEGVNCVNPNLIARTLQKLEYAQDWEILSTLCHDRAQRTVDRTLLVERKPITPERYLACWRKSFETAISFDDLRERYGLTVHACLSGQLAAMRPMTSHWSNTSLQSFAEFEAKYGDRFNVDGEGNFETSFDLREPDVARDAYCVAAMGPYNDTSVLCASLQIAGASRCQVKFGQHIAQALLEI